MSRLLRTPSYRLHRPSGRAVVTLNGKDFYLGPYGRKESRTEYDRLVAEWLVRNRRMLPTPGDSDSLTVSEVIAAFWKYAEQYYRRPDGSPTSEPANFRLALRPLRRLYGTTRVHDFGPVALKTVRQDMIDRGGTRMYINRHISRIKRMFKWAASEELVPARVFHSLQTLAGLKRGRTDAAETDPIKPVPDEFVDAVEPFVSKQVWAMIQLQRLTGMRSGEVVITRGCDLEMTGKIWLYRPSLHKTQHHGHQRLVEIGPQARAVIQPFLRPDLEAYLFSPSDAVAEKKIEKRRKRKVKVQPSQIDRSKRKPKRNPGTHYTTDSYRRAMQRACDTADANAKEYLIKAGKHPLEERVIPRWHPHQLRHNFATRIRKEFGVEAARILLGHRSTAVTELYAEVDRGKVREIVNKVG